jgi:TatD DNase family protein
MAFLAPSVSASRSKTCRACWRLPRPGQRSWRRLAFIPKRLAVREPSVAELVELARHPRVIAIGETGLDYYWHKDAPEWQRERFRTHIRAARLARQTTGDPYARSCRRHLRLMREEGAASAGGVMHCFTETWEVAEAALDQGFYISMSGIVTFKKAQTVREVAQRVPLDRLLVETDSPYLSPVPYRGKTNQPGFVKHVAEESRVCAA